MAVRSDGRARARREAVSWRLVWLPTLTAQTTAPAASRTGRATLAGSEAASTSPAENYIGFSRN
ncbi:hypothetical protein [Streptomyces sp. NPDC102437]|uniref:hypothetical protein n=1 Tax=Streptomyces sp. NPDC102437 TaxID=3366175 RepID=UPI00381FFAEC